jgi:hypothetical protein
VQADELLLSFRTDALRLHVSQPVLAIQYCLGRRCIMQGKTMGCNSAAMGFRQLPLPSRSIVLALGQLVHTLDSSGWGTVSSNSPGSGGCINVSSNSPGSGELCYVLASVGLSRVLTSSSLTGTGSGEAFVHYLWS